MFDGHDSVGLWVPGHNIQCQVTESIFYVYPDPWGDDPV